GGQGDPPVGDRPEAGEVRPPHSGGGGGPRGRVARRPAGGGGPRRRRRGGLGGRGRGGGAPPPGRQRGGLAGRAGDRRPRGGGGRGTTAKDANAGVIRLYERATGKELRELRGHLTMVSGLAFTPDGKTLVSLGVVFFGLRSGDPGESETKHVRVWDVATGKERRPLSQGELVHGLALAPDGRTAAHHGLRGDRGA